MNQEHHITSASYRPREPILIVEDRPENRLLLKNLCAEIGVDSDLAENGQAALKKIREQSFSIYIVDLMMPVMDGITFIQHLKQSRPDAVVLVQTALDESDTIIRTMKMGVYDYVIKPIDQDLFIQTLNKALEYHYLKDLERTLVANTGNKLRGQLEWLLQREPVGRPGQDKLNHKAIYNLKTNLSQGEGIGTTVTLIEMLDQSKTEQTDGYLVNKEIADELFRNNRKTRNDLRDLDEIVRILHREPRTEAHSSSDLIGSLNTQSAKLLDYAARKGMRTQISSDIPELRLSYEPEMLRYALHEVLYNAFKYGSHNSTVHVLVGQSEGYFQLGFRNQVPPEQGIPPEMEKLVTEPFFRILPAEEIETLEEHSGFGLGLTAVDYIVKKHNGILLIHGEQHENDARSVLVEILLPITISG
ncbi:MAG: response regulator [Leptospiraceae bacterium]|nr:response regulator [Leptospiraceae bacterium]